MTLNANQAQLARRQSVEEPKPQSVENPRKRPRVWTPRLLFALEGYLEAGYSDGRIARTMSRQFGRRFSADAIKLARKRHGLKARSRRKLTARAVARLLGIGCSKTVTRWIEQDWLKGRRGTGFGPHRIYMVDDMDLLNFLGDEDHWHRWQPERITDKALREWALEMRGNVRYLTVGEVAERCFVQPQTPNQWIHKGFLPAVRNGNWFVREDEVERFEPPPVGGRRKGQIA